MKIEKTVKQLLDELESYEFTCTGGLLEDCQQWQDLRYLLGDTK